jgi:hypothetical protein
MNFSCSRPKVLLIGGSVNQTSICHEISKYLAGDCDCYFTPFYTDHPLVVKVLRTGLLDFTTLGGRFRKQTDEYLAKHRLPVDFGGRQHNYDLVITTSDLLLPENIRHNKTVLVQEGMTDPENFLFQLVRKFRLPPWTALNTSAFGLSGAYHYFCVASEGYRQLFIDKGVDAEKIIVTGIPNFDHAAAFQKNKFPYRNYVLVATSDLRETGRFDRRGKFIREAVALAGGRPLVFKLHPNELIKRSSKEIKRYAPDALIFSAGNIGEMIANCDLLITQYSSVAFIGLALKKKVYSYFNLSQLQRLMPVQNGGKSGRIIAEFCRSLICQEKSGVI